MSKVNDNNKSNSNAVNVIMNSENNSVSNKENNDVEKTVSNDQNAVDPKKDNSVVYDVIDEMGNEVLKIQNISHSENFNEPPNDHNSLSNTSGAIQVPDELENWFRQLVWDVVLAAHVAYMGYQFYKKYLAKWMFIKPEPTLTNRLKSIEFKIQIILNKVDQMNSNSENEFKYIKDELKSIKLILANSHKILPVPASPRIPEWQLPIKEDE